MKKILMSLVVIFSLFLLTNCKKEESIRTLKVYNWVDYIDEALLDEFKDFFYEKHNEKIEVVYDTFETNESMYNTLKTGKTNYDLVCPSDYMMQKMIREGMVEKLDLVNYDIDDYYANASPYIVNLLESNGWGEYAVGYMWGTLGLIYNPEVLSEKAGTEDYDVTTWNDLNNPLFKGVISLKDSVRDSYCVGSLIAFQDELKALRDSKGSDSQEYNELIQDIVNRVDDNAIEEVSKQLRKIKENIYGLEVDSGKGDIVTGKIAMNLAWSGDAVYSIDLAEEEGIELRYSIPEEGANVWFDAWLMPKGADKELAQEFINFLSFPENAARNMNEIGYTSAIAGDAIYSLIDEWYGKASNELYVEELQEIYDNDPSEENLEALNEAKAYLNEATYSTMDLTYFFKGTISEELLTDGKVLIDIDDSYIGRQFTTQYPDEISLNRCGVMKDFEEQNEKVLQMWINVKANVAPTWLYITLISGVILVVLGILYSKRSYFARKRRLKKDS